MCTCYIHRGLPWNWHAEVWPDQIWDKVTTCGWIFESDDDLQLEGGVQPPLLDYKSAKAAASLGLSTYFLGSTRQPGIMDLKNHLHLQLNATGSHTVWHIWFRHALLNFRCYMNNKDICHMSCDIVWLSDVGDLGDLGGPFQAIVLHSCPYSFKQIHFSGHGWTGSSCLPLALSIQRNAWSCCINTMVTFSDLGGPQPASATTSCFLEVMDRTYDSGSSLCHDILCTICRFCPHIIYICFAFVPNHHSSLSFFSNLRSHLLSMSFASVLDNTFMFFDTYPAKPAHNTCTTEFSSLGPLFLPLNVFLLADIISSK